jgi:hypothetical protein
MPATADRIGFVLQAFRRATAETPGVLERHGALARKDIEPQETFFDDPDDALVIAQARQDLLSVERRRFAVTVRGLDEALELPLDGPDLPQARYIDELRQIDRDVMVAQVDFDFAGQTATLSVWG